MPPEVGGGQVVLELDERGRACLSPAEAAQALGVGISTIYKLLKTDELRFFHICGKTKISAADIARFVCKRRGERNPAMREMPWDRQKPAQRKHWPHPRKAAVSDELNK